jgi:hypothetical protein
MGRSLSLDQLNLFEFARSERKARHNISTSLKFLVFALPVIGWKHRMIDTCEEVVHLIDVRFNRGSIDANSIFISGEPIARTSEAESSERFAVHVKLYAAV